MKALHATFELRLLLVATLVSSLIFLTTAAAQNSEAAFTMGGYFPRHINARSNDVLAIQGNVSRRLYQVRAASLHLELPVIGTFNSPVSATKILNRQEFGTASYSALFVAPGVRLGFFPQFRLSPFLAVGGGLARFDRANHSFPSTNTGVLDLGAGLNWRVSHHFGLRAELRDLYSGAPQLITGLTAREHQLVAAGGIVLKFGGSAPTH